MQKSDNLEQDFTNFTQSVAKLNRKWKNYASFLAVCFPIQMVACS